MKKAWIIVTLVLGLCVTTLSVTASATGNESQDIETEQTVFVDLSDAVLQEGGYLPQTDAVEREITVNEQEASTSQEQITTKEQETPQRQITAEEQETLQEQDFIEGETASALSSDDNIRQAQEKLMAAWDAFEDVCDLSSYQIPKEEISSVYFETLNQNPKYFYVKSYLYYFYQSSTGCVTTVTITYNYEKEQIPQMVADYNLAVAVALDGADDAWSDMEKALYLNDYLARNCEYDMNYQNHSAYDALVAQKAVCQGYSLAFEALAKELGLSCEIVSSDSLNHAWDLVEINGTYYHVDVTWNDPTPDKTGWAKHQYFLKSTSYFKSPEAEHLKTNDWVVSGGLSDAVATDTSYDNCFWNAVNMGFDYIDGYWYGFDGTDTIKQYTCDGRSFSSVKDLVKINDVWNVLNSTNYWKGMFIGTGSFNGKLYYSGKDTIYELNTETGKTTNIFALSEEQKKSGYIYGMNITPTGDVKYILSAGPNSSDPSTVNMATSLGCVDAKHTNFVYSNLIEATCEHEGYRKTHCGDCGVLVAWRETVPKLPHTIVEDAAVEPTCTMEGKTQGSHCSVCENVLEEQETIPATGHTWSTEYTVDKEPTATEVGIKSIHCINCDETKDEQTIPVLGHESHQNLYIKNEKEATCSEEGYSGDTYCIECGDTLVEKGEIIPKLSHTVVVDSAAIEPTCTTEGKTQKSHCSVCKTVLEEQETIPATGHTWSTEYTVDKEPTATEAGIKSIHCINCDEIKDVQQIPALGSNTGNPNIGNSDTEDPDNGNSDTGNSDTEDPDNGNSDTEDSDTDGSNTETTPRQITTAVITLSQTSYSYDGSAKKPSVVSVQLGNVTLKSDDYTVSYQNNVNIGTATITITGKGNYTGTAKESFTISAKKGSSFSVGAYQYKITNSDEAAFVGLKNSKTSKVTIPKTVKIGGKNFKVTSIATKALRNKNITSVTIGANITTIGKEAFCGCRKLKTITVKSANLKSVGKNALKGIKASAKIKVPSKKLAAYKKLFKNKGQGKQVKITK